ncbi:hypothetical protein KP509_20G041000 [Ceratopteris richardii]|nr:hypothetical protein KP509_20G041000 [Ceratopteris richardii]
MVVLGSREQMCIHHEVKQLRGYSQNQACRALCKTRSCHHQNRVSGYLQSHPDMGEEPFDIEDLVNIGRIKGPCPYYMSRELHNSAEILFAPYNYLIEQENRKSLTGINWENTVLIFDEAHNLEGICADAASFDLSSSLLSACIAEAKECVDLASVFRTTNNSADASVDPENFAILKALLLELDKRINDVPLSSDMGFTKPGAHIFEFLADIKINSDTINMLLDTIDNATNLLEDETNIGSVKLNKRPGNASRLQVLRDALRVVFRGKDKSHAACYRLHIHEPYVIDADKGSRKGKGRTLSWWCFNPGLAMEEFSQLGVRSVILTSGTLSPLSSFALELKLPFSIRLENPHVIGPDQIWVGVVCTGPSGRPLNSSYRTRDSLEYKLDLGNTIVNFARIVPDGLLVFFPSYYLLNQCIEAWQMPNAGAPQSSTVWERICKHKQPVIEPKESALFNHANEDFVTKLNDATSSGAVFFAVCRGKVSEGLDFADKAGRAVIITGIPFAMKTDPKVRLKRDYLDEQARLQVSGKNQVLTGEEWYVQQASRAVNQAVGRVIRHKDDYGAIILCDERFAQRNAQNQLSLWLRPHLKCYSRFGDATFSLTRFFKDKVSNSLSTTKVGTKISGAVRNASDCIILDKGAAALHFGKSLQSVYKNIQDHRAKTSDLELKTNEFQIFGQKYTKPTGLHGDSLTGTACHDSQRSLSAILSSAREKSVNRQLPLTEIVPANRAVGSALGSVGLVKHSDSVKRTVMASLGDSDYGVIDLASQSPSKQEDAYFQRKADNCTMNIEDFHEEKDSKNQKNQSFKIPTCGKSTSSKQTESQGHSFRAGGRLEVTGVSNDKHKNAAEFLEQVKARLSAPEYKGFVECMKGLKQDPKSVFEAIANLFSAPERIFLLRRFGEFIPSQYRELYHKFFTAKVSAVDKLSERHFDGDNTSYTHTELRDSGLLSFPSRSRKRPGSSIS